MTIHEKIRNGLYIYQGYTIERMDEAAERYPGDDYYRLWRITSPNGENWLSHPSSLRLAKRWIDQFIKEQPAR